MGGRVLAGDLLAVSLLCVALYGCGPLEPRHAYPGEKKPDSEVARIVNPGEAIQIYFVDDNLIAAGRPSVVVLPGKHRIGFFTRDACAGGPGSGRSTAPARRRARPNCRSAEAIQILP